MGGTITRIRNGETVSVRTGVLRGAGPQGPMGLQGPAGPPGGIGPVGPMGSINDTTSHLTSTASTATSTAAWVDLPIETAVESTLLNTLTTFTFKANSSGPHLVSISSNFAYGGGSANGHRSIRLVDAADAVVLESTVDAVLNDLTKMTFSKTVTLDSSKVYRLQGRSQDVGGAINNLFRDVKILKVGAGPVGGAGPQGPVGPQGVQGIQGIPGSAASGFANFNDIQGAGADTTIVPPANNNLTADQAVAYPSGTAQPKTPYYIRLLGEFFEKRIVARFASASDRNTRRPTRTQGEVYHLIDTGEYFVKEKVGGTETNLGRVIYSTGAPPGGSGQASPGVIWIQHTA